MEDVLFVNDREHKHTLCFHFTACGPGFKLFTLRLVSPTVHKAQLNQTIPRIESYVWGGVL